MNTLLGDALQKALNDKKNDYSDFVWKGDKRKEDGKYVQDSIKMVDMSEDELKNCYEHCKKMLYSDDFKHLGRYNVLEEINEQIHKCNVELLLRYFENTYKESGRTPTLRTPSLVLGIRKIMSNNPDITDWTEVPINSVSNGLPDEFNDISVADVFKGCLDELGIFDKSHLTMTFITKMGIWFSKSEDFELQGASNKDKIKVIKERLHLPKELVLRISEKGLSYKEMRAILLLPKKQKYSDMTTDQLLALRNKILVRLTREIDGHIFSWKRLMKQLELVARSKNINLND